MADTTPRVQSRGRVLIDGNGDQLGTSSNPLATSVTTDSSEYTEDAASAADPTGPMLIARRRDTLVTNEVSATGDNIALNATNKGELRTNDADANAVLGTTGGAAVVTDANGTVQQYLRGLVVKMLALITQLPATLGPKTPALSLSVIQAVLTPFAKAAGLTTSPFGATGAAGDYLSHVILQPAAVGAGTTTIFNNATAVYVYTSGTLADLRPIIVPINAVSVGGSWNISTGANMSATGFGTFT